MRLKGPASTADINAAVDVAALKSRRQSAAYLAGRGIPAKEQTLAKLATTGGGPRFMRFGRAVLYAKADLDAWVESRLSGPFRCTAEVGIQKSGR